MPDLLTVVKNNTIQIRSFFTIIIATIIYSIFFVNSSNAEIYYIIIAILTAFITILLVVKQSDSAVINIFFGLFVYALVWGIRFVMGLPDDGIAYSDYFISLMPIICSLLWYIWVTKNLPSQWFMLALCIAIWIHAMLVDGMETDNEYVLIFSVIATFFALKERHVHRYVLLFFVFYQAMFSISYYIPNHTMLLKIIGIVPYVSSLGLFLIRIIIKGGNNNVRTE